MLVTRTYLELTNRAQFQPAFGAFPDLSIRRADAPTPALYRELYRSVGADYRWRDRWDWNDGQIAAHLAQPGISLHVARTGDTLAGFFELKREGVAAEIAYFGLMPGAIGRGLGKHLLSQAVTDAFAGGASRVWLHTCTLDHPAALPNYQARGFRVFKTEEYEQAG
jgi:ribosomal protein S18 acetylase RimI-like enzyme